MYRKVLSLSQRITPPGFQGESLYSVSRFFFKQMADEELYIRSSSLAFNFFLALFPAIIFLFTLIPYLPIEDSREEILKFMETVMPHNVYLAVKETINDILRNKNNGLLSLGFIMALYFSTSGFDNLMEMFNKYSHYKETRSYYQRKLVSIKLAFVISVFIFAAVALITFGEDSIRFLVKHHIIKGKVNYTSIAIIRWVSIVGLFLSIISALFFYAPSKKHKWPFFSAGSIMATVLAIIATYGFSYYVNNFGSYNKLYGSIGTLIVVLLLLQFNCMFLLIGFELNVSIENAVKVRISDMQFKLKTAEEEKRTENKIILKR